MLEETLILTMQEVMKRHLFETLDRLNGDKRATARALGIDRRTVYRYLLDWAPERIKRQSDELRRRRARLKRRKRSSVHRPSVLTGT